MSNIAPANDLTRLFVDKWLNGTPEMKKQGEYNLNSITRNRIRENGIARSELFPPIVLGADAILDREEDGKVLKKFMEVEPDSRATWVPFRGMPEARFVETTLVPVYFGKIESEEHIANIWELKNYNTDLRKLINDQDAKNLQEQEDVALMGRCEAIVAANPTEQNIEVFGGLNKVTWVQAQQAFFIDKPIKFALMNARTAKEFLKWDYVSDMGFGTAGSEMFATGLVPNVQVKIIKTIKDYLVPDNVVWFFAPEDFIGKFFVLQEPTTFIEQRKDNIMFSTSEVVGIGIASSRSFIKVTFKP